MLPNALNRLCLRLSRARELVIVWVSLDQQAFRLPADSAHVKRIGSQSWYWFASCRVGMELPAVEVRFQKLQVETSVYTKSGRNLPTILNAYRDAFEVTPCCISTPNFPM